METNEHKLIIAEYSEYPGVRYCIQGEHSGEDFYHSRLNEEFYLAFLDKRKLIVVLDGTAGYASSFFDEAFGNLVYDFSLEIVKPKLEIISNQEPDWKEMIMNDIMVKWEDRRLRKEVPRTTKEHNPWYRLENEKLIKKV